MGIRWDNDSKREKNELIWLVIALGIVVMALFVFSVVRDRIGPENFQTINNESEK